MLLSCVLPEDRAGLDAEFRQVAEVRSNWRSQCRIRRADDGAIRWIEFSGGPAPGNGGISGLVADITERKRAEEAQRHASEALERRVAERTEALAGMVNRLNAEILRRERMESALSQAMKMDAIGQMTGGVAHDFNNLLTVLVSHLDLIQHSTDDAARVRQLASAALDAADRGVRLTGHLLAFARRQTLRPEIVGINQLVRNFEPLVRRALGEAVELVLDLDEQAGSCRIDPIQFEVAMLNLAVNARDAMGEGGRLTMRTAKCRLDGPVGGKTDLKPGAYVEVSVADSGQGIPSEILERVFEPFFTTKEIGRGSGLGLSQVYGFAHQSGGDVRIESKPGMGTQVLLYLPCAAGEVTEPTRTSPVEGTLRTGRGELVLVVEDDDLVRAAATETLSELGYRVTFAADGAQALAELERGRPDVLFSDLVMPGGINGIQLAAIVRQRWPGLPILLASGYAAPDTPDAPADLPVGVPLLNKPYRRATLAQELRALLDGAQAAEPAPPAERQDRSEALRVLVVEDEGLIRMVCCEALKDLGHSVEEAGDGHEALNVLASGQGFDVLVTDIGLPGLQGTELARLARERLPGLWIVYMTGQGADEALVTDARTLVLPKPYRPEQLEQTMRQVSA